MAKKRRGGRRVRKYQFTPRRWLPFVALAALTAGALGLNQNSKENSDPSRPISAGQYLPVAETANAKSSVW